MTPQRQWNRHDPEAGTHGDCWRTCIAAILDLSALEVPHFYGDDRTSQVEAGKAWLQERGLDIFRVSWDCDLATVLAVIGSMNPDIPLILSGGTPKGFNHAVVMMNGEVICNPSDVDLDRPCDNGFYEVEAIVVSADWRGRTEPKVRRVA
jgi:hypothetical protein